MVRNRPSSASVTIVSLRLKKCFIEFVPYSQSSIRSRCYPQRESTGNHSHQSLSVGAEIERRAVADHHLVALREIRVWIGQRHQFLRPHRHMQVVLVAEMLDPVDD